MHANTSKSQHQECQYFMEQNKTSPDSTGASHSASKPQHCASQRRNTFENQKHKASWTMRSDDLGSKIKNKFKKIQFYCNSNKRMAGSHPIHSRVPIEDIYWHRERDLACQKNLFGSLSPKGGGHQESLSTQWQPAGNSSPFPKGLAAPRLRRDGTRTHRAQALLGKPALPAEGLEGCWGPMPRLCLRDGFSLLPSARIRLHKRKNAAPRLLSSHQTGTHQTMGRVHLRGAAPTPNRTAGWGGTAATHGLPNPAVARGGQKLTNPRFKSPGLEVARTQRRMEPPPKNQACFTGLHGVQTCKSVCSWVHHPVTPETLPRKVRAPQSPRRLQESKTSSQPTNILVILTGGTPRTSSVGCAAESQGACC